MADYSRPRYVAWTFFGATALGLVVSAQTYAGELTEGRAVPLHRVLLYQLIYCELWVPLAPAVFALVERHRQRQWRPFRAGIIWIAALAALSGVHTIAEVFLANLVNLVPQFSLGIVWIRLNATVAVNILAVTALAGAFVLARYSDERRTRELRHSQIEATLAEAKLDALRAQLQPHFLFNALHTVSALMNDDVDAARRVMARLAELLRFYLCETHTREISLGRELELVSKYLEIQQMRFQGRMTCEFNIVEAVNQALVPTMILQPVVENAVRHGIEADGHRGLVKLAARHEEGRLVVSVRDTGPGFRHGGSSEGIGLSNTRARLEHLYGGDQSLRIEDHPEGGCEVTINMPFRLAMNNRGQA